MGIDIFRSDLNNEQHEAVVSPDGPVLVLAAAGTGKTRTLVYRVAFLVSHRHINPDRILLLTFTNRAAKEMLERTDSLIGRTAGGWWGGTFHHFCNRILRYHAEKIGYKQNYTILDREDSRHLLSLCLRDRKLIGKQYPKPDVLLDIWAQSLNSNASIEEMIGERKESFGISIDEIERIFTDYAERKKKDNCMDFDDLLVNGLYLLKKFPDVRNFYGNKFLHILVDEYQDTNPLQAELVDLLASVNRNILVVGDDFQSIYSWRGADYKNIMSFPKRYPDARIIKLETNYRSVPEVLTVANACIEHNKNQFQKHLRAVRETYRKPSIVLLSDGKAQAHFVINLVNSMLMEGYEASEIAVLYRAHFHSMHLQLALTKSRIPYFVSSGPRFFEQAHIKDVMTIPRLIANEQDRSAFMRLVMLFEGIGQRTAEKMWEVMDNRFVLADGKYRNVVTEKLRDTARQAWNSITNNVPLEMKCGKDAAVLIENFLNVFYKKYADNTFEDADRRIDDIYELISYAQQFETMEAFLSDTALVTNLDAEEEYHYAKRSSVRLSTVHQAKGLEWRAVIVLWMVEGMFPSSRSIEEAQNDEEERRLFYVAVTRAKDDLFLCVPQMREMRDGGVMPCRISRFLAELPRDATIVKKINWYSLV